ncbi:MAG: hypothetical protein B7Y99_12025 [Caulobacterales bacterium 32-69-10]|nr:MAG: hypothetical protein B7Y99_12025 [Caulobacterales bacterium 32-69-10]
MDEPRRTRIILSLGAAAAVLVLVVVVQLRAPKPQPAPSPPLPAPAPVVEAPPAPPAPPPAPPALKRGDLIAAAAEAAAAFAEGRPVPDERRLMAGRRFQIVIPFSCRGLGVAADTDPARATVDAKRRTLTLAAAPQDWAEAPWLDTILGGAEPEAVEGFWVPRPWITGEACPAVPIPAEAEGKVQPTPPSLGLVQVFAVGASRVGQRGSRPYRVVKKLSEEEVAAAPATYRLILTGRIAALVEDQAVRCFSADVDMRPTCLIGVKLDKVRFEDAAGAETLAEWAD